MSSYPSSEQLAQLLKVPRPVTRPVIDYIVELTIKATDHGLDQPPTTSFQSLCHIKFREFAEAIIYRAEVPLGMLLATAAYITRSTLVMCIAKPDWAYERVFLGSLMLASKYHNDTSLRNNHWALVTGLFSSRDVSRVEREMLDVLNYELRIEEAELVAHECILSFSSPRQSLETVSEWRNNYPSEDGQKSDDSFSSSTSWDDSHPVPVNSRLFSRQKGPKRVSHPTFPTLHALRLSLIC